MSCLSFFFANLIYRIYNKKKKKRKKVRTATLLISRFLSLTALPTVPDESIAGMFDAPTLLSSSATIKMRNNSEHGLDDDAVKVVDADDILFGNLHA